MQILLTNIRFLIQADAATPRPFAKGSAMSELPVVENAYLLLDGERIAGFGHMSACPNISGQIINLAGRSVLPCWVDSHTHLVFAGSRENEFVDRIRGLSYAAIAEKGGGILNSAKRLRDMPEDDLFETAFQRLQEVQRMGTGAIEIKSGYGLTLEGELKMLRVIRRLREASKMDIRATFLGAHALPSEFRDRRGDFIQLLIRDWLPQVVAEGLADYIDVFCEKGFFSPAETDQILEAGVRLGLKPKIHTNQFNSMGGIEAAIRHGALSVDHLEVLTAEEIDAIKRSSTIPTLLPSAPFFLRDHYPPARQMIDAGLGVALASDFNPGSSPSGRMALVLTLACTQLRMTPEEAINAATLNAAYALEWERDYGTIAPGKYASIIITRPIPSPAYLPYAFGTDWIDAVLIKGKPVQPVPSALFSPLA